MARLLVILAAAELLILPAAPVVAVSEVQGRLTADGCTGRSDAAHGWGEEIIFMSPLTSGIAGGGCTTLVNPAGWYAIQGTFPAGNYLMNTFGFDRAPSFSVSSVSLQGGTGVAGSVELRTPAHYSVAYNQDYGEWGASPWIWGSDFYQTFVATSSRITRVATKLAGKSGDHYWLRLNFGIYEVTAGAPSTWPLVSAVRSYYYAGSVDPIIVTAWAPWRSDEMALTIGRTYALRMWAAPGSQASSFALIARPDTGNGYAGGQLYAGDTSHAELDAYAYISGGTPGTVTNFAPVNKYDLVLMANWATRFGQTFQATGTGLAGASIVYTTGEPDTPSLPITFQLYSTPGGAPIGPVRTVNGVHGYYQGRASVAWAQGEAPLTPGQMYYLEWTPPLSGCNTWFMEENLTGAAYVNGVVQGTQDLMMALAEYASESPAILLNKTELSLVTLPRGPVSQDTFTIRNSGGGTLNYQVSETASWLDVSPSGGSSTGEQDTITVTLTPGDLPVGTHHADIRIDASGAISTPVLLPVTLTVNPYPGDMDADGDLDMEDWGAFQLCMTASGAAQTDPACDNAHMDADQDVDAADAAKWVLCLSGPGVQVVAGCSQ